jgi:hypothetical protein
LRIKNERTSADNTLILTLEKLAVFIERRLFYRKVITRKKGRMKTGCKMNKTRQSRCQVSRITSFDGESFRKARSHSPNAKAEFKESYHRSRQYLPQHKIICLSVLCRSYIERNRETHHSVARLAIAIKRKCMRFRDKSSASLTIAMSVSFCRSRN